MATNDKVRWTFDPGVVRTIAEDSFGGWEAALAEALKNSLDADATRIDVTLPEQDALVPLDRQVVLIEDDGVGMTREQIEDDYCRMGRPKPTRRGTKSFGRRGTGKIATFKVVSHVEVDTRTAESKCVLAFGTADVLNGGGKARPVSAVDVSNNPTKRSGTRLALSGFTNAVAPPTKELVHDVLLRHFQHLTHTKRFLVNGEPFKVLDHAEPLKNVEPTVIPEVGTISGELLLVRRKVDRPGIVVYSGGQAIYGPTLFDVSGGAGGDFARTASRLIGRIEVQSTAPGPIASGNWEMSRAFKVLEKWAAELLEGAIGARVQTATEDRVESWLRDPTTRRYFSKLSDPDKAAARRLLSYRARKVGDGGREAERLIARLIVRALASNALSAVLEILEESSEAELEEFGSLFKGKDRWNLRQVTRGASFVKMHMRAIEDLEACVADYSKNENAIHEILAENPWLISDDHHSFRSNRQIRTTLRDVFKIDTDDPMTTKRPDFFFVLGDAASNSLDQKCRFLFVELKGPDQPLTFDTQNQVIRDTRTFLRHKPGFAFAVLLGTSYDPNNPAAPDNETKGEFVFRSMTFDQLIERAKFRVAYMLDGVKETGAEEFARRALERQIARLMDQPEPADGTSTPSAAPARS